MGTAMKSLLRTVALFVALLAAGTAHASPRFWVGGTGTWDGSTTTHWSATSGGAGGASVPATPDSVTFDSNSGTGVVTVNTTIDIQFLDLSGSGGSGTPYGGTLDFSANNNNVTLESIGGNGSALHCGGASTIFNMGSGTWTIHFAGGNNTVSAATVTPANLTAVNSTVVYTPTSTPGSFVSYNLGNATWGTLTFNTGGFNVYRRVILTTATITTLNLAPGIDFYPNNNLTITNFNANGTAYNQSVHIGTLDASVKTLTITNASISWSAIGGITFAGSAITATNSFDLGGNSGTITITGPSGGGGRIIGG